MSTSRLSLTITTPADALQARQRLLALAKDAAIPFEKRLLLVADVFDQLRTALADGTAPHLKASVHTDPTTGLPTIRTTVGKSTRHVVPAPATTEQTHRSGTPVLREPSEKDRDDLVQMLADNDSDTRALVDLLDRHRIELETTNQGVLVLHAELDAANHAQTELLSAEQAARELAETARRRLTFLSTASATLTRTLNHEKVLQDLTGMLVPEYAATARIWLLDERRTLIASTGDTPDASQLPADHPAALTARTGRVHHARADRPATLPGATGPSLLALPLTTGLAPLGVLALTPAAEHFTPDDIVMLTELARRAATALDNARSYEHERNTAAILQRAMLTDLPTVPGLRMAARYLPASEGMNIGGDWYDAFLQPDGTLTTVIGDVTGHGLDAAVLMGQLRHALRAYALQGHSPGALLTLLHNLMRSQQPGLYATALITQHQPAGHEVTWATAGHLPPLLRTPDGAVQILDDRGGALLGLPMEQIVRDHRLTLAPGSTLLLYTDGLVERRTQGVDPGIQRLATALAGLDARADSTAEQDAETLLADLLHDNPGDDDICLLLCHADPPRPALGDTSSVPCGISRRTV
ncbi:PP2C family protein-serine/threonine phosphatase [Streptomyces sp. NPDC012825]|uniref:PP2C family protein-serine/threonine phosphatase n=1 Tax=Streptomyces sp. NPDC012825 TaxID=3364851 RepID=UPI0036C7A3B9